jgi:hypothetical protein
MRRRGLVCLVLAVSVVASPPAASANLIEVGTDADEFGAAGPCAFREAVEAARTNHAFGGCPKGSKTKRDTVKLIGDVVLTIHGNTAPNADGDIDYDGGGPLTVFGAAFPAPDYPTITQDYSDRILEITHQKGVRIEGVEMQGGGGVNAGGAVRTSAKASLTIENSSLHDNIASLRGGALACEGCKSLKLTDAFRIEDNLVSNGTAGAEGGGIWSNAPLTLNGQSGGFISFANAAVTANTANPASDENAIGGGIYAARNVTVKRTFIANNRALDNGFGGGIGLYHSSSAPIRLRLIRSTVDGNSADGEGGGVYTSLATVDVRDSAITANHATGFNTGGSAFAGGLELYESGGTISNTVIADNDATATAAGDSVAGGGLFMASAEAEQPTLHLARTSITGNSIATGTANARGGGVVIQGKLDAVNSTFSENSAPMADAVGGGLRVEVSGNGNPTARLDFSTIKDNLAGTGVDDGDGIASEGAVTIRASVLDEGGDGCDPDSATLIDSKGFNVEEGSDPNCAIDAASDTHAADFLPALAVNGSPPVGTLATIPLTHASASAMSSLTDAVPAAKCKVGTKPLKTDARGVPRPVGDGCDVGAIERIACHDNFLVGPNSFVGTNASDQILSGGNLDVVLAQGGDDQIATGGAGDSICAGKGDDVIGPGEVVGSGDDQIDGGAGIDFLTYNNSAGGLTLDLTAGTAVGPIIGTDTLLKIEQAQGSETVDTLLGDAGPNLLVGGGGVDMIKGRGGIDVIDAKDNVADALIDCGPGKNSKEKAKIDKGLDPKPKSC